MSAPPELTTFGAVIRFAAALETEAAAHYERWLAQSQAGDVPALVSSLASDHAKRAARLERLVREQLNEMTLEPIAGLRAERYSGEGEPPDAPTAATSAALEERLARLYTDLVEHAGRALGGAARSLQRFADESQRHAERVREAGSGEDRRA